MIVCNLVIVIGLCGYVDYIIVIICEEFVVRYSWWLIESVIFWFVCVDSGDGFVLLRSNSWVRVVEGGEVRGYIVD